LCVLARRPSGAAPSAAGGGSGDPEPILACARIGIRVERERPWRFLLKGSPFVSVPPQRFPSAVAE
jgi:3-methyladenine DNA glycosylase Mpg